MIRRYAFFAVALSLVACREASAPSSPDQTTPGPSTTITPAPAPTPAPTPAPAPAPAPTPAPAPAPAPTPAPTPSSGPTAAGDSDSNLPTELFACHADADCVATRPGGCCFNGRMTAVNASKVDAYAKASPCGKPHPICPQYRVQENRVPRCNTARQRCEMVNP